MKNSHSKIRNGTITSSLESSYGVYVNDRERDKAAPAPDEDERVAVGLL